MFFQGLTLSPLSLSPPSFLSNPLKKDVCKDAFGQTQNKIVLLLTCKFDKTEISLPCLVFGEVFCCLLLKM